MYKISVPLMSTTITKENRQKYLSICKEVGASRIFLALAENTIPENLKENISFFKENGYEVGVWISTIGHGFVLSHAEDAVECEFKPIVDIDGTQRLHANCPLDEKFRDFISKFVASLAKLGPDIVMLDDDLRLSQHGPTLCCACENHLNRISKILGEPITLEFIKPYVISGKANKYRDAWIQAQNESLIEFAKCIRAKVDKETPDVTICNCIAYAPWDVDGIDVVEISRILAGKNKPLLRLTGAPYWATKKFKYPLAGTFEIARMLASFVQNEGIELMSEGDVYPRPRYTCPASYLELYDAATRADGGYDGILKYMFDYVAGPDFETGYIKLHNKNKPLYEKLHKMFPTGANAGVRIYVKPHNIKNADLDISPVRIYSPIPQDAIMLGQNGIPTIYKGKGVCNSVFGENARDFDLAKLNEGTIIDAVSAMILTERGVDVGLKSYKKLREQNITYLHTSNIENNSFITDGNVRVLDAEIKDKAEPLLFSSLQDNSQPFAYCYENQNGERFLVFLFEGASIYVPNERAAVSGITKNYATQEVLINTINWLSEKTLPAYCDKNPELYLICEQDENTLSIGIFNCFADPLTNPVITLSEEYSSIEALNCEAELSGNSAILTSDLPAFSFAVLKLYK